MQVKSLPNMNRGWITCRSRIRRRNSSFFGSHPIGVPRAYKRVAENTTASEIRRDCRMIGGQREPPTIENSSFALAQFTSTSSRKPC